MEYITLTRCFHLVVYMYCVCPSQGEVLIAENTTAILSGTGELTCERTTTEIYWFDERSESDLIFDGSPANKNNGTLYSGFHLLCSNTSCTLSIDDINVSHEGVYSCADRSNTLASERAKGQITVTVPPLEVKFRYRSSSLQVGEGTRFVCIVSRAKPAAGIEWIIGGTVIETKPEDLLRLENRAMKETFDSQSQYPYTAQKEHNKKTVYCRSSGLPGISPVSSQKVILDIRYEPSCALEDLSDADTIHVKCKCSANPEIPMAGGIYKLQIYKNNQTVTDGSVAEFSIPRSNVNATFFCRGNNILGESTSPEITFQSGDNPASVPGNEDEKRGGNLGALIVVLVILLGVTFFAGLYFLFREKRLSKPSSKTTENLVIGMNMLGSTTTLVSVRDKGIHLCNINREDRKVNVFRDIFIQRSGKCVVMSPMPYHLHGNDWMLLGANLQIIKAQVMYENNKQEQRKIIYHEEEKIGEGSKLSPISAIYAYDSNSMRAGEFLVALQGSSVIYRYTYDAELQLTGELNCVNSVKHIMAVACTDYYVAVAEPNQKLVTIYKEIGQRDLHCVQQIFAPKPDFWPKSMFWAKNQWLILWINEQSEKCSWLIYRYNLEGERAEEGESGEEGERAEEGEGAEEGERAEEGLLQADHGSQHGSQGESECRHAVSIGRHEEEIFLMFSDGSFRTFLFQNENKT